MSTHIEFRHLALSLSMAEATKNADGTLPSGTPETLYLMLCECGDSNVTRMVHRPDGKVSEVQAKDWRLREMGTPQMILEAACHNAYDAVGGCIHFRTRMPSGEVTPEAYISKYRRTVAHAAGHWDSLVPLMHATMVLRCTDAALATSPYLAGLLADPGRLNPNGTNAYWLTLRPGTDHCGDMLRDLLEVYRLKASCKDVAVSITNLGYLDAVLSRAGRKAA